MQPINCPQCGFRIGDRRDYNALIKQFMERYSKRITELIRRLHKEIITALPSEDLVSLYFFLLRLDHEEVTEQVIESAIDQFFRAEYHLKGKGYRYLQAIVMNIHLNINNMNKYENDRIGSPPPIDTSD